MNIKHFITALIFTFQGVAWCAEPQEILLRDVRVKLTEGQGDHPDQITVLGAASIPMQRFNRSRGVEDVIKLGLRNEVVIGGRWLKPAGAPWRLAPGGSKWLGEGQAFSIRGGHLELKTGAKICRVSLPVNWRLPDEPPTSNVRWAVQGNHAQVLTLLQRSSLARGAAAQTLPMKIDPKTCGQTLGAVFPTPGFDSHLQAFHQPTRSAIAFALWSAAEGELKLSQEGLNWISQALPPETHVLLSVHADNDQLWVAVADATQDFATAFFKRVVKEEVTWQRVTPDQLPGNWFGAQLLLTTRLVP